MEDDQKKCSVCLNTGRYINSYGRDSGDPCHLCDPKGFAELVADQQKRLSLRRG